MCPPEAMRKDDNQHGWFYRIAGLLCIVLIGALLMGCGLALAFGNYKVSSILFFLIVILLVAIRIVARSNSIRGHNT